jgi:hypothetical protein
MKRALAPFMIGVMLGLPPADAAAQTLTHVLSGVVYDSVAGAALPSAIVQAVELDSAMRATRHVYWGVADTRGRYKIAGIPSGRFAVGFQHDALNALGLESPLRVVDFTTEADISIDLAIPSGTVVRAQSCATGQGRANDGMLAGYVLDAASDAGLDSVAVDLRWVEVQRSGGSYRTVPHHVSATVSLDGQFAACGVATGAPVNITIARKGYRDVTGEITIPDGGAVRRDFHLSQGRAQRGTATLIGRVIHADSMPLSAGRVLIPALGVDVPVVNGNFTAAGLPAGTWMAEARAIGYEPQGAMIDLVAQTTSSTTIVISNKVQLLEGISVVGKPGSDYRKLVEILERKQVGFGTFFMPGDERLARADRLSDVVQLAAGFHIDQRGALEARVMGGSIRNGLQRCHPTLYVDGFRDGPMPALMSEVLAVAAYPDMAGTPVQWRDPRTCAVIAVWTKR